MACCKCNRENLDVPGFISHGLHSKADFPTDLVSAVSGEGFENIILQLTSHNTSDPCCPDRAHCTCVSVQALNPCSQVISFQTVFQPLDVQTVMAQAMPTYTVMSIVDIVMSTAMSTMLSTIMCIAFELIYLLSGSQFLEPDGWFPNHVPNPEDKTAMAAGVQAVQQSNSDLGVVLDTDVDRSAVVARDGQPINSNRYIALMSLITLR